MPKVLYFTKDQERRIKRKIKEAVALADDLRTYWKEDDPHRDLASVMDIAEFLTTKASEIERLLKEARP